MLSNSIGEVSLVTREMFRDWTIPFLLASNENNANANVSSVDWPRESNLYLDVFRIVIHHSKSLLVIWTSFSLSHHHHQQLVTSIHNDLSQIIVFDVVHHADVSAVCTLNSSFRKANFFFSRATKSVNSVWCIYSSSSFFLRCSFRIAANGWWPCSFFSFFYMNCYNPT